MKKLCVMAVAVAALCLTACGGQKTQANPEDVVDSVELSEAFAGIEGQFNEAIEAGDTAAFATALEGIQSKIAEYIADGKNDLAEALKTKISEFIDTKADAIKAIAGGEAALTTLTSGISNIPTTATEVAKEAVEDAVDAQVDAAKDAANEVKDAAKEAVNEKVDAAKEAVNEKVDAAKESVNNAKENAKQKTSDAIDNAASNVKKGLGL